MSERELRFQVELNIDEAFFKELLKDSAVMKRAKRMRIAAPIVGVAGVAAAVYMGKGFALMLLICIGMVGMSLMLPEATLKKLINGYEKDRADGLRRMRFYDDGIEMDLVKYDEMETYSYLDFNDLSEDKICYFLSSAERQLMIPKECQVGDSGEFKQFLWDRLLGKEEGEESSDLPETVEEAK